MAVADFRSANRIARIEQKSIVALRHFAARGTRWLYVVAGDCPTVRTGRSKLWRIDETAIAGHWTAGRICTAARSREETWRFTHFDRAQDPFRLIRLRNCCHQRARIGMERMIEDRPRPGLLHDPAHIHDSNAAADLSDHAKVVRDEEHRQS